MGDVKLSFPAGLVSTLEVLERDSRELGSNLRRFGRSAVPADGSESGGLVALESALEKATKDLGADQAKVARRTELEKRLQVAQQAEVKAKGDLAHAEKAPSRLKEARDSRLESYESVFQALTEEERTLQTLYSPLQRRMEGDQRMLKLSFSVRRVVDTDAWAAKGESLLDLRKHPFQRRGQLAEAARKALVPAWRRGTPSDVRTAMTAFLSEYGGDAVDALAQDVTPLQLGEWCRFAGSWGHLTEFFAG
ncbi:MAG: hypothetical protein M3O50_14095 [Myxococcota bacterium]|nr:hypothetical protein [Myxococcota bacterium]